MPCFSCEKYNKKALLAKKLRWGVDKSSEDPHANADDNLERYKSDSKKVRVELGGGLCWGEVAGDAGRVIIQIAIPRGNALKEKRLE